MVKINQITKKFTKQIICNIVFSLLLIYFALNVVFGNRGMKAYIKLNHDFKEAYIDLLSLRAHKIETEHIANLLRAGDKDILEQYAKEVLGMAGVNEKVFTIKH